MVAADRRRIRRRITRRWSGPRRRYTSLAVESLSYAYHWELGERRIHDTDLAKVSGTKNLPVMWDGERFHGGNRPGNYLHSDGHVTDFDSATVKILYGEQSFWK